MFNVKWGLVSAGAAFFLALIFSLLLGQVMFSTALFRALIFAVVFFLLGIGVWVLINSFIPELLHADTREGVSDIFTSRETPGSRVNITVGGASGAALPDSGGGKPGVDDVGDISDLISGKFKPPATPSARDMDQMSSSGYNKGDESLFPDSESGDFTADFSSFTGGGFGAGAGSGSVDDTAGGAFDDFGDFTGAAGSADSAGGAASAGSDRAGGVAGDFSGVKASDSIGVFDDGDIFSSAGIYSSGGNLADALESDEPERKTSGNKPQEFEGDFNPKEIAAGLRTVLAKENKG
jgi:hypothetical protein